MTETCQHDWMSTALVRRDVCQRCGLTVQTEDAYTVDEIQSAFVRACFTGPGEPSWQELERQLVHADAAACTADPNTCEVGFCNWPNCQRETP